MLSTSLIIPEGELKYRLLTCNIFVRLVSVDLLAAVGLLSSVISRAFVS